VSIALLLLPHVPQVPAANPAAALVGNWAIVDAPALSPGLAPFASQSFEISLVGTKIMVTFERQPAAEAVVYLAPRAYWPGQLAIVVEQTVNTKRNRYHIRWKSPDRAEVEMFITRADGSAPGTYAPLGTFAKAK
jgi:hypothetical protein